jgi:preprotein translocase subunit SecD
MKKRSRFLIFLLCLFFGLFFLFPTYQWYYIFNDHDRLEASYTGDKLKNVVDDIVNDSLSKMKEGKSMPAEEKAILNAYKEEIKINNKYNPENKIVFDSKMKYSDLEKELLKIEKQKNVDRVSRNALEDFYTKKFNEKKKVKDSRIKLGLDLQGGAYAVVTINFNHPSILKKYPNGIPKKEKDAMIDSAVIKIENRINKFGIAETSIQKLKDQDKIIINLPGVKEASELRQIIETVGVLEFKIVSRDGNTALAKIKSDYASQGKSIVNDKGEVLPEVLAQLPPDTEPLYKSNKDKWGNELKDREMYVVEKESLLGENVKITSAAVQQGQLGQNVINFVLEGDDAKKWAKVTGDNIGKEIAIILDNVILEKPVVQDKITGGHSQITLGNSPVEELQTLATILKSGSMNVPLEISEENTVGASLGQDTINKGLFAFMMGTIFVFLFMFLWYNVGGIIADVAVVLNILLLISGLALLKGTLTLPGLAGIVLTIGMAVDANVIIYERIKEEFRTGKTFKTSVHLGFDRAFWTILDSNLTTFLAGVGLAIFGTGPIKGFATTLCLGIITTLFTALFVSRLLFDTMVTYIDFKSIRVLNLWRGK